MVTYSPDNVPTVGQINNYGDILTLTRDLTDQNQPFQRILELVFRQGAKYFLLWHDSENSAWKSERELCYSRMFPSQPEYLIRLDFFKKEPKIKENKYFGYVSLRPGPVRTVAESYITPPPDRRSHYLLSNINLNTKYPSIDGNGFIETTIKGVCPFIQQDGVVGVCAHACIRMMSVVLEKNFQNCKSLTMKDIQNRISAMPLIEGSHIPSSGLTEYEIFSAVEGMGVEPILRQFDAMESSDKLSLERVIYPYIESGIPVMVSLSTDEQAHGIVVVGHTFDRDSWWQKAELGYFPSIAGGITWIPSYTWVPDLIIQDDNFGPYLSVPRTLLRIQTAHVVLPIPKSCDAFLTGYEAESLVASYLVQELYKYIIDNTRIDQLWKTIIEELRDESEKPHTNVVLRPILISRESLARHLEEVHLSELRDNIYRENTLPKYFWLVEISIPELYSTGLKIGEMIINSSYPQIHITGLEPLIAFRIFDVGVTVNNNVISAPTMINVREPTGILTRPSFA
jgi:hypothetical protein